MANIKRMKDHHCPGCGGNDIAFAAQVIWDPMHEEWVIDSMGTGHCKQCPAEFAASEERPLAAERFDHGLIEERAEPVKRYRVPLRVVGGTDGRPTGK